MQVWTSRFVLPFVIKLLRQALPLLALLLMGGKRYFSSNKAPTIISRSVAELLDIVLYRELSSYHSSLARMSSKFSDLQFAKFGSFSACGTYYHSLRSLHAVLTSISVPMNDRMIFQVFSLLAVIGRTVSASENLRGGNLHVEQLLDALLAKFESQGEMIEALERCIAKQDQAIASLQEAVKDNTSHVSRTLNSNEECLPYYNATLGYCVNDLPTKFEADTVFEGVAAFENNSNLFDDVRICLDSDAGCELDVGALAYFKSDVNFDQMVEFNNDVTFLNDVTVEGPAHSSADASEFIVKNRVDMTFAQDNTFVVDTESLFREDMTAALEEDVSDDLRSWTKTIVT